jgi:hypothetical protein
VSDDREGLLVVYACAQPAHPAIHLNWVGWGSGPGTGSSGAGQPTVVKVPRRSMLSSDSAWVGRRRTSLPPCTTCSSQV